MDHILTMQRLLWTHMVMCVLSSLATHVNNIRDEDKIVYPSNHFLGSHDTVDFINKRNPLSKATRRVMLYIFDDIRLNPEKTKLEHREDSSKTISNIGKQGGEIEFQEIHIVNAEHPKTHGHESVEDVFYNPNKNGKNSPKPKVQSDQQPGYETDILFNHADFPASTVSSEDTGNSQEEIFLESTSTCDHVNGYYRNRWLRLVAMCPMHWTNETVRKRCESWDMVHTTRYIDEITMLPVQDSLGVVYGNAFCAICHNVYPIYPWTTVLQCDTPSDYDSKTMALSDVSILSFLQNLQDNAFCKRIIMPSFPASIVRCEDHMFPKATYYRSNPLESLGMPSSFPVNFNVLMNFDFTGQTHILFSAGQQVVQNEYVRRCNVGETFDTYSKRCRPVRCSSSHRLEEGKCVPTGDSLNGETVPEDFDLSSLHETSKVSLSVNISFGLYLIFQEQEDLNSIVAEQIADNLNISIERIKHINVSFDFGSINKTGYQVQKLSQDKYKEYFPSDSETVDITKSTSLLDKFNNKIKRHVFQHQRELDKEVDDRAVQENNSDEFISSAIHDNDKPANPPDTYMYKSGNVKSTAKKRRKRIKALWIRLITEIINLNENIDSTSSFPLMNPTKTVDSDNDSKLNKGNTDNTKHGYLSKNEKIRAKRTNNLQQNTSTNPVNKSNPTLSLSNTSDKTKPPTKSNHWEKIQGISFDQYKPNASQWDTLWSLLQPMEFRGQRPSQNVSIAKTRQSTMSNITNMLSSENKIYLSPPLNKANDRMLLGAISDVDFEQPMAMRISFILVPPDDPASDEEEAVVLLKKIGDLITDREFTLLVSGNEVSVVNSDDPEEDEEKANNFCPWGVMFIVYDDEFSIIEVDNITMLYVNRTRSYHGIGRFDLWVMVKGKNSAYETSVTNLKEYAFVCFMPRILQQDCQRITLTPDEYQVMSKDNRSIIFEENEYNITTYSVLNETSGEIQICVPQSYDPNKGQLFPHYFSTSKGCGSEFNEVRQAEGYLTIILGRVSIAAQALVLITYFLFPSLRNLPGCNIMNLTLALFIAETIFEEGMLVGTHWRCVTVAITLHYFFLASHFWMNVMSFDVFRAFAKPNVSTGNKNEKQNYFRKYFVYAWGMPAIIVGICCFIEFSELFSGVEMGYGGTATKPGNSNISIIYSNFLFGDQQNIIQDINIVEEDIDKTITPNITFTSSVVKDSQTACWIQSPLASLLAFGAPILLIFISNCIFFTQTIISISRTVKLTNESLYRQHSNSSYSKTTGRSEAMLYLRMSTVMGFTWVFGFSSAIISSVAKPINTTICIVVHIHSILFVIFNISQGLFIFVAFLCNRRVLRLYLGLFYRLKRFVRRQSYKSRIYSISSNSTLSSTKCTSTSVSSLHCQT